MTHVFNDPARFADELVEGLVAANRSRIVQVDGGVIRRHRAPSNSVVMVTGGGSGHYPAFGGLVGQGIAHGAAMGNVFASPSADQICAVAQAVNAGGGILFCYNNYAGDVLNFDEAQRRLRAQGLDVRSVVVNDDVASAPLAEAQRRRGIAGSFAVFKAAGFACDSGANLDEVVRIAAAANERVRSVGVAFSGCTLPGASAPLFKVEPGQMEVGMGIHGEPGLQRMPAPTAHALAQLLVERLLAEVPSVVGAVEGARVAAILNGLGAVKYEELFVIYRSVDRLLTVRGITLVEPEVGELVTSFDMAGVSLSLVWLDEELERSWCAAADTPAFRKGSVAHATGELAGGASQRTSRVLAQGSAIGRIQCLLQLIQQCPIALQLLRQRGTVGDADVAPHLRTAGGDAGEIAKAAGSEREQLLGIRLHRHLLHQGGDLAAAERILGLEAPRLDADRAGQSTGQHEQNSGGTEQDGAQFGRQIHDAFLRASKALLFWSGGCCRPVWPAAGREPVRWRR